MPAIYLLAIAAAVLVRLTRKPVEQKPPAPIPEPIPDPPANELETENKKLREQNERMLAKLKQIHNRRSAKLKPKPTPQPQE